MHTTVVLGCPIEQVADSELVPTPDESLIISLVSPRLLSICQETKERRQSVIKSTHNTNNTKGNLKNFPSFGVTFDDKLSMKTKSKC